MTQADRALFSTPGRSALPAVPLAWRPLRTLVFVTS